MRRSVRFGNRSRYSKREADVDRRTSCGSEDASAWGVGAAATDFDAADADAAAAAAFALGFPLLVDGDGPLPALFRLDPAMAKGLSLSS